ncbi:MAG: hypothetical protein DLM67_05360 [Candidatus Nephthysia bennettiae]|uniref:Uncharacterized protein n=1 Tax=Candidatus Nephthysia bennettiae TaxID=3127016 RepID=A0A934JVX5_9BACT|nr:hypothetical protein [Candidatus Dormibacteraeota bacterium]MBJ7614835.1 hypothetical protein [Candidatus Dormibacteraeota bacterium]PZR98668.1 MAG: hypothetical protein DLM67_05360 [Candidatus Dormibacteraeota bacterium]
MIDELAGPWLALRDGQLREPIAEPKQWRPLQRWTGRRETLPETMVAIGALVSDRAAKRPTIHTRSTALVLVRPTAC